jgi:FkbM family methyltransferase
MNVDEEFFKILTMHDHDRGDFYKNFTWPKTDEYCYKVIMKDWHVFKDVIFKNTPERKAVVQAGGNAGLYPYLYNFHFEKVFTFEPDPINFHCLTVNNPSPFVVKSNIALGDKCEWINLIPSIYGDNSGMATVSKSHEGIPTYSITIDSLNIANVSLIHLDVEGFEYYALKGAEKTIKRCKPTIVAEIFNDVEEIKIFKFLKKYNYIIAKRIEPDGPAGTLNIIYVPGEKK